MLDILFQYDIIVNVVRTTQTKQLKKKWRDV